MIRDVRWSSEAINTIRSIKKYLIENWSELVADNFLTEVERNIAVLKQYPEIGRASKKNKAIRKIKVTKFIALYYRTNKNLLEIIDFFDQRQSPEKNRFE